MGHRGSRSRTFFLMVGAINLVAIPLVVHFGKVWIDKRFGDVERELKTVSINSSDNTTIIEDMHKQIRNISTQEQVGKKNQAISIAGDHNVSSQTINETRADFKNDSVASNLVAKRIGEGQSLIISLDKCKYAPAEFEEIIKQVNAWYAGTITELRKISAKAAVYFSSTDTSLLPFQRMDGCSQKAYNLKRTVRKYVGSLNDILKGL